MAQVFLSKTHLLLPPLARESSCQAPQRLCTASLPRRTLAQTRLLGPAQHRALPYATTDLFVGADQRNSYEAGHLRAEAQLSTCTHNEGPSCLPLPGSGHSASKAPRSCSSPGGTLLRAPQHTHGFDGAHAASHRSVALLHLLVTAGLKLGI